MVCVKNSVHKAVSGASPELRSGTVPSMGEKRSSWAGFSLSPFFSFLWAL